ncbi:MAG: hypothetical protein H6817_07605 [Phycisphaerales bacterium]|nr:hypothetical protein [Phycisphaerales bacterium]
MTIGHKQMRYFGQLALAVALCASAAFAQTADQQTQAPAVATPDTTQATNVSATPVATSKPATSVQPAAATGNVADPQAPADPAEGEELRAIVIEVEGTVESAPGDANALDMDAWKPVEKDQQIAPDTQIRTGMRSKCTLQFGEGPNLTVIQLRRGTLAKISDYRRTIDEQRIRIGLGYGAVRGGSSEGTLRSDVVVDSTVATLAKRGTEGWEIEIEPVSGTFHISLARSGLVEAFSKDAEERRRVHPGEYATDGNIARMWINQEIFDRAISPYEFQSLSPDDIDFMVANRTGYSSLGPGGNQLYGAGTRRPPAAGFGDGSGYRYFPTMIFERGPVQRPEGNFGFGPTFRVLVPKSDFARVARRSIATAVQRR